MNYPRIIPLTAAVSLCLGSFINPLHAQDNGLSMNSLDHDAAEQPAIPSMKACGSDDWADTPARAFKDAAGGAVVFATGQTNRILFGPDLKHLRRDCNRVVYKGGNDGNQQHNNDRQWIHSTWTEDGKTVYALMHNEYQGHNHLDRYPECRGNYQKCWRNSITLAKSTDGGRTFTLLPEKERTVVDLAYPYASMLPNATGFMNPSNMFSHGDYIMAFLHVMSYKDQRQGNYLIRKARNAAWTSTSWEIFQKDRFVPIQPSLSLGRTVGTPINLGTTINILPFSDPSSMKVQSVSKYVQNGKYTGKYVALMSSKQPYANESWRDGFYIATSYDLINWSKPVQVLSGNLRDTFSCALNKSSPVSVYRYGSLLDEDTSAAMYNRNFETIGDTPMLFTTRINYPWCGASIASGTKPEFKKMKVYMSRLIRETNP